MVVRFHPAPLIKTLTAIYFAFTYNDGVVGSNPTPSTNNIYYMRDSSVVEHESKQKSFEYLPVAQLDRATDFKPRF